MIALSRISRYRWTALVFVAFLAVVLLAFARPSIANDPRVLACGAGPSNTVTAAFDLASAQDYRAHFPNMVAKPELEGDSSPAFVVVITGPVDIPMMHAVGSPHRIHTNAVCVYQGQATEPTIYLDEDLTGFKP